MKFLFYRGFGSMYLNISTETGVTIPFICSEAFLNN
jgi:hypothetical protein